MTLNGRGGFVIPNFVSGLTDGWRFTPADTEFEDKTQWMTIGRLISTQLYYSN
jgi:hypothetical protein